MIDLNNGRLYERVRVAAERTILEEDFKRLKHNFELAAGLYQAALENMRRDNPNIRIPLDNRLFDILRQERVEGYRAENGVVFVDAFSERTIEIPVQDEKTKGLLQLFALEMRKIFQRFPQLTGEMDIRITEFIQQEVIDVIGVDEINKLVEIVKYVPQVVRVENYYEYSSEKTRKIEYHLRILLKGLLEEFLKLKAQYNLDLELDEGIFGMIKKELIGIIDIDDILKIFRSIPKIVEVEKIIEKVVERVVEVPKVVTVEKVVEKVVEKEVVKEV